MGFWNTLGSIAKVAAPVVGSIVAPGIGTALGGALSGAIGGAQAQSKAGKLNDQVLKMALARDQELAPLRAQAIAMGQNLQPARPDLSSAFASGNPFARQKPDVSMLSMPRLGGMTGGAPTPPARGGMGGGMGGMGGGMAGMNPQALQQALRQRGEMMA